MTYRQPGLANGDTSAERYEAESWKGLHVRHKEPWRSPYPKLINTSHVAPADAKSRFPGAVEVPLLDLESH